MAKVALPNGATIQVATALAAAIAFAAITNAEPPVLSAVGHGLDDGDYILIDSGWSKISDRGARVSASAADAFSLEGFDTTNTDKYTAGAGIGAVRKVEGWVQISKVTAVSTSGGEQQFLTYGYLEEDDDRQAPTNRNPISMQLTVEDQPKAAYVERVEELTESKELTLARLILPNGDVIVYPAYVSITETPTLERNALMTRTVTLSLAGRPIRYLKA